MIERVAALVLAAGRGTRLRPLTGVTPKPLLPVVGRPLVSYTLERLRGLALETVAVNVHHLGEQVVESLGARSSELEISFSREGELLGTMGALGPLRKAFAGADRILVVNGDSLCRWPLKRLLTRHRRWGAAATLLLTTRPDPAAFGGGVGTDPDGRVFSVRGSAGDERIVRRRVFAGAHVLEARLLDLVPDGPADFVTGLWEPLLASGEVIASVCSRRAWHDLGTPGRYLDGVIDWSRRRTLLPRLRRGWTAPQAELAPTARVLGCVIEPAARIGDGARLERCVLLPQSEVGAGCRLRDVVVGFGARVPPGTEVEGRLVTRPQAGLEAPATSSRVGDLILTPL